MAKTLGIDLGTTISKMAAILNGEPKCLENREGSVLTPSVVALAKNNEVLVGVLAERQSVTNPQNTIHSIKRFIGRRYSDSEVQKELKLLSYQTREKSDGGVEIKMGEKWHTPIQISAMILQKLKMDAQEKTGEKIDSAVITCPANFDDSQRKATKAAGEIAGLKVLRIINEPTAAALAYGLTKKKNLQIAVYDFGGGTFDVSILNTTPEIVEVIATGGEPHLGGRDFDQRIINWVIDQFKKDQGIDLSKDSLALQRLKEASERVKIELSSTLEAEINLPFITSDSAGPKHLLYKITRAQFENLTHDLVDRSIDRIQKTLDEAKMEKSQIDEIVLVGGTTLIPLVREAVKKFFSKEPNKEINPEEVVAMGASIEAEILKAKEEGRVPQGDIKSVLLLDVLPLSLGIETLGGINTIMIPKNTTIPSSKSQIYSTAADSQTSVEINVLQGERPMAKDNRSLGRFILDGIPPAPRGIPQIEVSFDVNADGIITVGAKDKATSKSQSIKIEGSVGLSKEEIEKIKKEAEMYAQEDKRKRELSEAKNSAEALIYSTEKTLKDLGDKITQDENKDIEEKIESLKKTKESDNIDEIKSKIQELSGAIQKIGEKMYKKSDQEARGKDQDKSSREEKSEEGEYHEKS